MPLGDCVLPYITFTNIRTLLVIMGATYYVLSSTNEHTNHSARGHLVSWI